MTLATNHPNLGHSGHFAPFEFELYGGLSPTNNDTDGDGLYDGPDVSADYALDGKAHKGEMTGGTKQLKPDTDGDSITDGQEVNGILAWSGFNCFGTIVMLYNPSSIVECTIGELW